jgi:carbon monoxide dehydrogenase subunit G
VALVQPNSSGEISAAGQVAAPPEEVFAFLADLQNHWQLADRFVEVLTLDRGTTGSARGGTVRVRGPLGLGRTATTQVVATEPPTSMTGTAALAGGTQAVIRWTLTPEGEATRVELAADLKRTGRLDRLLLMLGGRAWIRRRFAAILQTLSRRFSAL